MNKDDKVLLHVCCAVCSIGTVLRLRKEGYSITGFYYNPNIHPSKEYLKRLNALKSIGVKLNFPVVVGDYESNEWFSKMKGFEKEPEGGKRCDICFKMRLEKTYDYFKQGDFDYFTTTLTISPHKKAGRINRVGERIGKEDFLKRDFKKKNGFKKSIEKAKKFNIYTQNYCGCIFSKR